MRLRILHRNQSGIILLTVLMVVLIFSVFVSAIVSQNLSQSSISQSQIDEIQAKEMALGAFWAIFAMIFVVVAILVGMTGTGRAIPIPYLSSSK